MLGAFELGARLETGGGGAELGSRGSRSNSRRTWEDSITSKRFPEAKLNDNLTQSRIKKPGASGAQSSGSEHVLEGPFVSPLVTR